VCVGVSVGTEVPFEIASEAAGPGQSVVSVSSPSGVQVPCSVTPLPGVGSTAKFVPTEPGPHNVQVAFADQPVPGSPFTTVATQVCTSYRWRLTYCLHTLSAAAVADEHAVGRVITKRQNTVYLLLMTVVVVFNRIDCH